MTLRYATYDHKSSSSPLAGALSASPVGPVPCLTPAIQVLSTGCLVHLDTRVVDRYFAKLVSLVIC